jgi:hypothetical protein
MGNTGTKDQHVHYQLKDPAGNVVNPTAYWDQQGPIDPNPSRPAYLPQYQQYLQDTGANSENGPGSQADDSNYRRLSSRIAGRPQTPGDDAISTDRPASFDDRFGNWSFSPGGISSRNPNMSLPPQAPMPSSVAPAAPLAPAANPNPPVGGLLARLMAAAGVDPDSPNQPAPPPLADQLRGFYRDDPSQPWFPRRR